MEVFSILIDKAIRGGYLAGYNFRNNFSDVTNVSHLLFADDTLVFCKDSEDELLNLSWILLNFEALLVLRINLENSVIMPVCNVDNINQLAYKLGCRVRSLPSSYRGLPLGPKLNSTRVWEGIEDVRYCTVFSFYFLTVLWVLYACIYIYISPICNVGVSFL